MLIEDTHTSCHQIFGFDTDLLIDLLHLIVLRLRLEVGEHNTVHDEHTIIGEVAEVTPIGQIAKPFGRVVVQRLVYPVPDSTTADVVRALDSLPVVRQTTTGIPHRVGVFGDMEGVLDLVLTRSSPLDPSDRRILIGAHIDDVVITLILHGA